MVSNQSSVVTASNWVLALLGGTIATALLSLAIAGLGFSMLTGRLPLRRAGVTIAGCFVMLGASTVAAALMGWSASEPEMARTDSEIFEPTTELKPPPKIVMPDNYDPYAGAAVMPQRPAN